MTQISWKPPYRSARRNTISLPIPEEAPVTMAIFIALPSFLFQIYGYCGWSSFFRKPGCPRPPSVFLPDQLVIFRVPLLDQRPLHGLFVGIHRNVHLLHGPGIQAGKRAGMTVLAVEDDFSRELSGEKKALADGYICDYSELL